MHNQKTNICKYNIRYIIDRRMLNWNEITNELEEVQNIDKI